MGLHETNQPVRWVGPPGPAPPACHRNQDEVIPLWQGAMVAKDGCHHLKGARQPRLIHQLTAVLILPPSIGTTEAPRKWCHLGILIAVRLLPPFTRQDEKGIVSHAQELSAQFQQEEGQHVAIILFVIRCCAPPPFFLVFFLLLFFLFLLPVMVIPAKYLAGILILLLLCDAALPG